MLPSSGQTSVLHVQYHYICYKAAPSCGSLGAGHSTSRGQLFGNAFVYSVSLSWLYYYYYYFKKILFQTHTCESHARSLCHVKWEPPAEVFLLTVWWRQRNTHTPHCHLQWKHFIIFVTSHRFIGNKQTSKKETIRLETDLLGACVIQQVSLSQHILYIDWMAFSWRVPLL